MALDLGKQIGPLPLGAWVAVVGTGLGIAYYSRNQGATDTTPTIVDDTGTQDGVGTGVDGNWINVTPPTSTPAATPPQDNDEWGRQAIDYLVSQGYDAAVVQSAIAKALQGVGLSPQEWVLWKIAITRTGAPPFPLDVNPHQNVPGPTTPPHKPPTKKPSPVSHKVYVIRPGDTLASVSKRFYGNKNNWDRIYESNRKGVKRAPYIKNPGWLTVRNADKKLTPGRLLLIRGA